MQDQQAMEISVATPSTSRERATAPIALPDAQMDDDSGNYGPLVPNNTRANPKTLKFRRFS